MSGQTTPLVERDISIHGTRQRFAEAVGSLQDRREPTLGELIDAAVLAHERFRTCRCHEDCPHDGATLDADDAVKLHLIEKNGLTADQVKELGGLIL